MAAQDDVVAASAKGATFLILLQIGSRAVTFALNQILLRYLSPELLGAAVQLELFVISALYFARESLRIAAQRRADGGVQAAVNLSYLAIFAGGPLVVLFRALYLRAGHPDVPYFTQALTVSQLTVLVELLSEPAYVAAQQRMLYKTRAAAEASAVVVKTLLTAGLVIWSKRQGLEWGVLPFAIGEFAYACALTVVYLWQTAGVANKNRFKLWPVSMTSSATTTYYMSFFSRPLLYLAASLYLQTGIKWLLTEGDKFLIAALSSLQDQGMYALSANYGGLIARMLFRPIEDSARNLFASLCSSESSDKATAVRSEEDKTKLNNLTKAADVLRDLLRVYGTGSILAFAIGPTAAPLLLQLVAGSRWSDSGAGQVLATYCYCIPLLAINGVSEALVSATASTSELQLQSFWMGMFSAGFAASAFLFLRVLNLGARGLVWANCVNMALRIVFNLNFAVRYFSRRGVVLKLSSIWPNVYLMLAIPVVSSLLAHSRLDVPRFGLIGRLGAVGTVGAAFAAVVLMVERGALLACYRRFRS